MENQTENQPTASIETAQPIAAVAPSIEPVAHICGECHKIAECSVKLTGITYTSLACEKFKKKRGRPASTVKSTMGITGPVGISGPGPILDPKITADFPEPIGGAEHIPPARRGLFHTKQFQAMQELYHALLIPIPGQEFEIRHLCVMGPAGTGKNEGLFHFCHEENWPVVTINCSGDMRSSALLGRPQGKGQEFYFQDGLLVECMRNGWILNLDEVNAIDGDIGFLLHGVMTTGILSIPGNSEIVRAHPRFRIVATCNPLSYVGTKPMNEALKDRFFYPPVVGYDQAIDKKYLSMLDLEPEAEKAIMRIIQFVRTGYEKGEMSQPFGHRTLKKVVDVAVNCQLGVLTGLEIAYLNCLPDTDRAVLQTLLSDLARVSRKKEEPAKPTEGANQ